MSDVELIRGYATALFRVAEAEDALDRVAGELFEFAKAFEQNHDLRMALGDIAIPDERKQAVIRDLMGTDALPVTEHIIDFVVAQGRARELPEIVNTLAELAAQERDKVLAEVRSAVPLDEDQRTRLGETLSRATGKTVDVRVVVDPKVVGGILARVGDQVIDATVRARLQDLKETIGGS